MKTLQTLFSTPMLTCGISEALKVDNLFDLGIRRGLSGKSWFRDWNATRRRQVNQLTTREREVLQLVAAGKSNKEIAAVLFLSVKTVEKHRGTLKGKLGIHETAGLTRYAIATGFIQCSPSLG